MVKKWFSYNDLRLALWINTFVKLISDKEYLHRPRGWFVKSSFKRWTVYQSPRESCIAGPDPWIHTLVDIRNSHYKCTAFLSAPSANRRVTNSNGKINIRLPGKVLLRVTKSSQCSYTSLTNPVQSCDFLHWCCHNCNMSQCKKHMHVRTCYASKSAIKTIKKCVDSFTAVFMLYSCSHCVNPQNTDWSHKCNNIKVW